MEALSNIQFNLFSSIGKAKVNFKKSPKERLTISYVETRLESLESEWITFSENHLKIVSSVKPTDLDKSDYGNKNLYETTKELYFDYKTELKEMLKKLERQSGSSSGTSELHSKANLSNSSSVKLPKIQLPIFSGNYAEWISFRDLFLSLIHNNNFLDEVQKLHYLKTHLTGEAEALLRHIPVTSGNYSLCWLQLENRYNNKKYLANCILKRFMSQKNVQIESSTALKELLDTSNECLYALSNLGINVDSWDIMIIYILCLKLDNESRKLWEAKICDISDDLPKYKQFQEFLEQRFRALEFLDGKGQRYTNRNISVKTHHVSTLSCPMCQENHKLANCKRFGGQDIDQRRSFAQTNNLCYNCLGPNHNVFSCHQSTRCRFCKKKHHTLLHLKNVSNATNDNSSALHVDKNITAVATTSSCSEPTNVVSCFANKSCQVLLATALVKVESKNGTVIDFRCLLDQGSQASFITESAVQLLGLRKIPSKSVISGLGGDPSTSMKCNSLVMIKVQSRLDPSFEINVKAYVLKRLTTLLPERRLKTEFPNSFISAMILADPHFDTPNKVDLLLGAEVYGKVILDGIKKCPSDGLLGQNTKLGWILSGQLPQASYVESFQNCHNIVSLHIAENDMLQKFWEIEAEPQNDFGNRKRLTPEEQQCEEFFSSTTRRELGRYVVRLPFKSSDPLCKYGKSKEIALNRFLSLEKRLMKDPELKLKYAAVIREYLELNHMERIIDPEENIANAVYLPHHAVVRNDKSTTKVRVVFDASCVGTNGVSLNNDLIVGPPLQPELRHIIMRWRSFRICLVADIVKMYRQVKIAKEDADFLRLYWRENPSNELQHLRHLRVPFGTASAPYLAVRSLQQLAYDEGSEFPLVREKLLSDFYMDDLMTGCESVSEGEEIYKQMTAMLNRGGFQLQKWGSNSVELMKLVEKSQVKSNDNMEINLDTISKILGLTWNKQSDEFSYTVHLPPLETPITKRKVVSDIAKLFDPLGWLAPVIITAKIFIQRLWLTGIEWDSELPNSLLKDWLEYREDLKKLTNFRVPRWIQSSGEDQIMELHGFSDASNLAYAAVIYVRIVDRDGNVWVNLVTSKTKVAPIKQISIPRLELCGAVLLAKLIQEVATILNVNKCHVHAWTDSSVVLAWLSSHPSRWKTFVGNRVAEILSILDRNQWSHVVSKENPADCASRGVKPSEMEDRQLWKNGPSWLRNKSIEYKVKEMIDTKQELRKTKVNCYTTTTTNESDENILLKFSKLVKLIRVVAYCKRFLKRNRIHNSEWLTTRELNEALLTVVKICQNKYFKEDLEAIKRKGKLNKKSKLTSLNPFIDNNGILRVGGRLQKAPISDDMKHPILIPHDSPLTKLLIVEAHERLLHGGPQLILNYLRLKYWIINARTVIRKLIRNCVTCVRNSSHIRQPIMGELPKERLTVQKPFQSSGVDYAGPISIRTSKGRGHHATKGYICLFVCMSTKAIHLEVVSDMTTQGFLAAFKRFSSRRGRILDLWSDNGTTFVGGAKELKNLFNFERSSVASEIVDFLVTNGTNWHFIPPHAPNFGGLWEAGVKSTKHHLKRVIGNSTLTFEEMTTVLCQVEACLNSRPISRISNNHEDQIPLTPGHFLVGEPLIVPPEFNYETSNISNLRRWQVTQKMLQDFWRRWSMEYLTQLQHRYKWTNYSPEPSIGDVVLVKEDGIPPCRWLYGIIKDKHPGSDNQTRVVTLKCKNNEIKRPISKLIILPITQ